jgi:hypothetical protein
MSTIEHLFEIEGDVDRLAAKIRAAIQKEREKPVIVVPPVDPDPGTLGIPAVDLQSGIDAMRAGDTLLVEPGVFYGAILVRAKPGVTIKARVPGTVRISGLWEAADRGAVPWTEKWGVWSAKHGDSHLASVGDRFLFKFGSTSARPVDELKADTVLGYKRPFEGYAYKDGEVFLRLPDNADPNGKSIQFCDKPAQNIIKVINSLGITLEGLVIDGSGDTDGILFDKASEKPKLRKMAFSHCRRAARLPHGADVDDLEYTYRGLWNFYLKMVELNGVGTKAPFVLFKDRKGWSSGPGNSAVEGGAFESCHEGGSERCKIRRLYCHEVFDARRLGAFKGVDSGWNIHYRCLDDGGEFEAWQKTRTGAGNHEHHSLFQDCIGSFCSHQDASGGLTGDAWVSHCMFVSDEVHCPMFVKVMNMKGRATYAFCEFAFKSGFQEGWADKLVLAQGMKGQKVPDKIRFYNCVMRGDDPDKIDGAPIIKGTARARNTTEAVDIPPADLGPIQPHAFMGPNIADDKDWPRPMRTVFAS